MGIRNWFASSLVGITDHWPRGLGWENLDLQNCTRDGVSSHRARCTPVWNRPNPLVNNMPPGSETNEPAEEDRTKVAPDNVALVFTRKDEAAHAHRLPCASRARAFSAPAATVKV